MSATATDRPKVEAGHLWNGDAEPVNAWVGDIWRGPEGLRIKTDSGWEPFGFQP